MDLPLLPPIGIVGSGAVARSLGRLLKEANQPVAFVAGRKPENARAAALFIGLAVEPLQISDLPKHASRLLIAVSDDALAPVASLLAEESSEPGIAVHTCGSRGPEILEPLARIGYECGVLHPLQTVPSAERGLSSLIGSYFGVCGSRSAVEWATSLVAALHGKLLEIPVKNWALYHAAAAIASNYQATLVGAALALFEKAGLRRSDGLEAISMLVRTTMDNILELGPERGLTGPIRRGDTGTIRAHLEATASAPQAVQDLYRACALATLPLAVRAGLAEEKAARIERLLKEAK